MNNFVNLAKTYSKAGYSVIPVGTNKIPTIRKWSKFQNNPMTEEQCEEYFENAFGMALICGGKHSLTTIDIDLKNDLSGDLYERLKDRIPKRKTLCTVAQHFCVIYVLMIYILIGNLLRYHLDILV